MTIWFGALVPQGWKAELAGLDEPQAKWAQASGLARLAEDLGYRSVWVHDHFHRLARPAGQTVLEGWAMLAALSQQTSRVRLGQLVGGRSYRNPSLLAKITATLDVISGGRLELGIGAGWYEHDLDGPSGSGDEHVDALREVVEIVTALWTQPETTYDGRSYRVVAARCDPKPVQRPRPPLLVGGRGAELALVARYADRSQFGGTPEQFAAACEVLKDRCREIGRDYEEIEKTTGGEVCIRETEEELRSLGTASLWGEPFEQWAAGNLVGTPEQVCEKVQALVERGCRGFILWCSDYPDDTTLRLLATDVMPEFP